MKKTIDFFLSPEETFKILNIFRHKFKGWLIGVKPEKNLKSKEISPNDNFSLEDFYWDSFYTVYLSLEAPSFKALSFNEVSKYSKDWIDINIGYIDNNLIKKSNMLMDSDKPEIVKVFNFIKKEIVKLTKAGMWGVNEKTGGRSFYKNIHYSPGLVSKYIFKDNIAPLIKFEI